MVKVTLDVARGRRAVRDLIDEIDYVAKLSPPEKEWLEIFVEATAGNGMDAQAALTGTPERFRKLYTEVYQEHNARQRDMAIKFTRLTLLDGDAEQDDDGESDVLIKALVRSKSEFFYGYRCTRCLSRATTCVCPKRERNSPYSMEDYTPIEVTEADMVGALDIKRRIQAYDLLPYGDSPKDLDVGHPVQICLPHHLFKDAWGYVIDYRPMNNTYLIEIKSKSGLRDRDGVRPEQITMWVSPDGLKRYRPSILRKAN